jgi:hypothetical protein
LESVGGTSIPVPGGKLNQRRCVLGGLLEVSEISPQNVVWEDRKVLASETKGWPRCSCRTSVLLEFLSFGFAPSASRQKSIPPVDAYFQRRLNDNKS